MFGRYYIMKVCWADSDSAILNAVIKNSLKTDVGYENKQYL